MNKADYLEFLKRNKHLTLPIFTNPYSSALGINPYDLTTDASKHAEVLRYIDNVYDFGFVTGLMDLSLEVEGFGTPLSKDGINLPLIGQKIINSTSDAFSLNIPVIEHFRTGVYVNAMRIIKSSGVNKPVLANVISPFTMAALLLGTKEIIEYTTSNPEIVYTTLEKVSIYLRAYYRMLLEAGADGLFICDPMAGFLSHSTFDQFSTIFLNDILDELDEETYIVYHNCANVSEVIEGIKNIHADIFHFGDANDLEAILKTFPKNKLVMGNISPINVFRKKGRRKVEKVTSNLLKKLKNNNNFIISPGCDLPIDIKPEKIISYLKAIDQFFNR